MDKTKLNTENEKNWSSIHNLLILHCVSAFLVCAGQLTSSRWLQMSWQQFVTRQSATIMLTGLWLSCPVNCIMLHMYQQDITKHWTENVEQTLPVSHKDHLQQPLPSVLRNDRECKYIFMFHTMSYPWQGLICSSSNGTQWTPTVHL